MACPGWYCAGKMVAPVKPVRLVLMARRETTVETRKNAMDFVRVALVTDQMASPEAKVATAAMVALVAMGGN